MIPTDEALAALMETDPYLRPWGDDIRMHMERYEDRRRRLAGDGSLCDFANGFHYFGFHREADGWVFREWLPGADRVFLIGDFNGWSYDSHPLENIGGGVWEIRFSGRKALCHGQHVKLFVHSQGRSFERIPAYITRCEMDHSTYRLCGQIWAPDEPFPWTDGEHFKQRKPSSPLIYEAHIGMAQEREGVGTYREFADRNLDWIKAAGYNTVQLMAIQEHPYYASFGYQVTNFFAPSGRFGTPEDLKYLIDRAHGLGLFVLLDVVHSHACPNVGEGLSEQDGTDGQYFLSGDRGWHPAWQTRIFNYGRDEVIHFLLSNLKYWQEEFHFDGFRFDGVTSIMYENHGMCAFGSYDDYFSMNTNVDGRIYLMLANELIHGVNEKAMTIAEDMSGFPGMCLPLEYGGVGFDYRLNMGAPDMWIKLLKDQMQEDWNMHYIWHELTSCRPGEMAVSYCESHDQALVGDKTLMFWLADAEMYTGMKKEYHSLTMDRAIDMHKVIRFITCALAPNGYLNFMGNEFGHPEWVDFPREGNNWSYHYARRQWSLVKTGDYKYDWLAAFDRSMTYHMAVYGIHCTGPAQSLWIDNERKLVLFERGGLLYAFNLHPTWSQETVFINCRLTGPGGYKVVLSTDDWPFGGQSRVNMDYIYRAEETEFGFGIKVYLPCRTGIALQKVEW